MAKAQLVPAYKSGDAQFVSVFSNAIGGSLYAPEIAVKPYVVTGDLRGVSLGKFFAPSISLPLTANAGYIKGQLQGFLANPDLSITAVINPGSITGQLQGSLGAVSIALPISIDPGSLSSVQIGKLYAVSQAIKPEISIGVFKGYQWGRFAAPRIGLVPIQETKQSIAEAVWETNIAGVTGIDTAGKTLKSAFAEATLGRQMQTNKAVISNDERNVYIYADDGQTLLHSFDVSADKLTREPQ